MIEEVTDPKPFKLPKEFYDKWKEALLSGKYQQATQTLVAYEGDDMEEPCGYCCLGVALTLLDGYDHQYIAGGDAPTDIKPVDNLVNDGFPREIASCDYGHLGGVLAALNDGMTRANFVEHQKRFTQEFKMVKEFPEDTKGKVFHSFKDIVDFMELNVETYEEQL